MERRAPNKRSGVNDTLLYYEPKRTKQCSCLAICCIACCVCIFILLLLAVLLVFVGIPYIFKNSPELQQQLVFPRTNLLPENPEYSNFEKYDIKGARALHVTNNNSISLGVWHLLPHALITNYSIHTENFDYSLSLAQADFPVIIHFHSNGGNRIRFIKLYDVLRVYFHVIAFDYRGYADSTDAIPTEEGLVEDALTVYKWVRNQTRAKIYFWGHGLGAAVATRTINKLREDDIEPMGLFLEAPFSSMRDQVNEITILRKLYSWLPYYESTILEPLEKIGFALNTAKYIMQVDCPIMIIQAEDDTDTPPALSKKVFNAAQQREFKNLDSVTYHLVPAKYGCGRFFITYYPELTELIKNHTIACKQYELEQS